MVEFAWQGGEPTLLGLDFYKQAVEFQQQFGLDKNTKLTTLCKRCEFKKLFNGGCPKHRFIPIENELNLHNYLCPSYRYFFEKTMPYMQEMARSIR
jgi:predicted regulator of arylsulfatase activity